MVNIWGMVLGGDLCLENALSLFDFTGSVYGVIRCLCVRVGWLGMLSVYFLRLNEITARVVPRNDRPRYIASTNRLKTIAADFRRQHTSERVRHSVCVCVCMRGAARFV